MNTNSATCAQQLQTERRNRLTLQASRRLMLLAPTANSVPHSFRRVQHDSGTRKHLLHKMQKLRGEVYLREGAISQDQMTNGRHVLPSDEQSWQILVVDEAERVCGCATYREHANVEEISQLGISRAAVAQSPKWGKVFHSSVSAEIALAQKAGVPFVELGSWALDDQTRGTIEALRMALVTYTLAMALGGGVGITMATHRNGSAGILRKIGGLPLSLQGQELPPYFDPHYGCHMEMLRFYSWAPNPRFLPWVEDLNREIHEVQVVTSGRSDPSPHSWQSTVPFANSRTDLWETAEIS